MAKRSGPSVVFEIRDIPANIRHDFLNDIIGILRLHALAAQPAMYERVIQFGKLIPRCGVGLIANTVQQAD